MRTQRFGGPTAAQSRAAPLVVAAEAARDTTGDEAAVTACLALLAPISLAAARRAQPLDRSRML
ncbi:MAG: hypothetical protein ACN6QT_30910 [Burkholderia contaminans]|uniref:Uncharacterized protein n=1 Tax=Burkholderia contaminans TaxID=488447 RepID=A0AAP4QYF0_9BURK|nr:MULTISPECIES: hypothetical protein [Burkholderia]MBD1410019.1 hypothetical protein [Burkholderia contaminans]MBH9705783.1 hypothetical protein [Burkholderia contaminans]MCA7875209.1 hypothetical protein [Burkholderia contaminans]MDN7563755.1 hypothetical protein [Burkholderia contaminans]MDN8021214.1 hypothetical protein [Burkholderia contaminans]